MRDEAVAAVIVDVDGTLVDVRSVRHHVDPATGKRNFHKFHAQSIDCPPVRWVVDLVHDYDQAGYAVLVVTGRSRRYERLTSMWLALHDIPSAGLWMRRRGDQRSDVDIKREILTGLRRRYRVVRAVDDNPSIIDLWRAEGIPVTVVPGFSEQA